MWHWIRLPRTGDDGVGGFVAANAGNFFDGDRWASRQGASLLRAAGLEEFAAADLRGYVEKAVGLAGDPGKLGALRAGMRERLLGSAVCDTAGFAREMEGLYLRFVGEGTAGG